MGIVVVLLVLYLVPFRTTFSVTVVSEALATSWNYWSFPANSPVTFTWKTTDGGAVTFTLENSVGSYLYHLISSNGSFSFISQGGLYGFGSLSILPETVQIQGSYTSPILH